MSCSGGRGRAAARAGGRAWRAGEQGLREAGARAQLAADLAHANRRPLRETLGGVEPAGKMAGRDVAGYGLVRGAAPGRSQAAWSLPLVSRLKLGDVYVVLKALLSGAIIAAASELARRSSLLGAVLISLPLASILAMIWLYRDTGDADEVAALSWSILWVIVPSVVFFVVLPLALRGGVAFWPSMLLACAATAFSYAIWVSAARLVGLKF